MRKLVALLLVLVLALGMVSTASAKKAKTLNIYWIGNQDDETIRTGVEEAINEYVEPLIGANVSIHIINWDDWTDQALKPLLDGEKIDLIFTADWRDYVQEITAGALLRLDGDQLEKNYSDCPPECGLCYCIRLGHHDAEPCHSCQKPCRRRDSETGGSHIHPGGYRIKLEHDGKTYPETI